MAHFCLLFMNSDNKLEVWSMSWLWIDICSRLSGMIRLLFWCVSIVVWQILIIYAIWSPWARHEINNNRLWVAYVNEPMLYLSIKSSPFRTHMFNYTKEVFVLLLSSSCCRCSFLFFLFIFFIFVSLVTNTDMMQTFLIHSFLYLLNINLI